MMGEENKKDKIELSQVIHIRIAKDLSDRIDRRVEKREFESRPDFFKVAVRWYLDYLDEKDAGNIRKFIVPNVKLETPRSAESNKRP
jgi:metal-responsive CopG/Arc/MetJ family transcriptional regulator